MRLNQLHHTPFQREDNDLATRRKLIKTIDDAPGEPNYNEVVWDGVDADGDLVANGLYLYVVEARGEDGTIVTSDVGRMVVARGPRRDRP